MGSEISHIEDFSRYISGVPRQNCPFLLLDPGGEHQYLFTEDSEAIRLVGLLITGEGLKRDLGNYILRGCSYFPSVTPLVPFISNTIVSLPRDFHFDVAVVSNRTRLIQIDSEIIHTLPTNDATGVVKEIKARRELPDTITTPKIYESDLEFPYFSEQFIRGWRPKSPIKDWEIIKRALRQLETLYQHTDEVVVTSEVISNIRMELKNRELYEEEPFSAAFEMIDHSSLPEKIYKSKIHGDLHTRNLLVNERDVYIVDWEMYKTDYVFRDFFKPFVISHYDTRDPKFFHEMITNKGRGGEVFRWYLNQFGDHVCDEPEHYAGLPVLYLLIELSRKKQNKLWNSYRELLRKVINQKSTI